MQKRIKRAKDIKNPQSFVTDFCNTIPHDLQYTRAWFLHDLRAILL